MFGCDGETAETASYNCHRSQSATMFDVANGTVWAAFSRRCRTVKKMHTSPTTETGRRV